MDILIVIIAVLVLLALVAAFVLSLTVIPALVSILIRGRVNEKEIFLIRWAKRGYEPLVRFSIRRRSCGPVWRSR